MDSQAGITVRITEFLQAAKDNSVELRAPHAPDSRLH